MPYQTGRVQPPYIYTGNFQTENNAVMYKPGEIGIIYDFGTRRGQNVYLDSGCTASTSVGVVASGQVAFWKSKPNYIVTNDSRFAEEPGNPQVCVAGVFTNAVTAGYQTWITTRQVGITLLVNGTIVNAGYNAYAAATSASNVATFAGQAAGTGPTNAAQQVGIFTSTGSASATADINFPENNN